VIKKKLEKVSISKIEISRFLRSKLIDDWKTKKKEGLMNEVKLGRKGFGKRKADKQGWDMFYKYFEKIWAKNIMTCGIILSGTTENSKVGQQRIIVWRTSIEDSMMRSQRGIPIFSSLLLISRRYHRIILMQSTQSRRTADG
jgi:hypothetical protein